MSATTVLSSRQGNLFWIYASELNVAGSDYSGTMSSMANFGDCKLYEVAIEISGAGAGAAAPPLGVYVVLTSSGTGVDVVGSAPFVQVAVTAGAILYVASVKCEVVRLWRASESLTLRTPDVETATTTGDVAVYALVKRMRDVGATP